MAAVNGTAMYKLPEFYNNKEPPQLPNCMYKMKSYHTYSPEDKIQVNGSGGDNLHSLERRQDDILNDLENLRKEVDQLAGVLGVKLPEKRVAASVDYVISASPEDPPLAVFAIQHIMNQRAMPHATLMFRHSSATNTEINKLPQFEKPAKSQERRSPFILTVVWKNDAHLPFLVLSSAHSPLVGEHTIARHLCRTLVPDLYGNLTNEDKACVDNWLDLAQTLHYGSSKEKASVLRNLNSHLGKSSFLCNGKLQREMISARDASNQVYAHKNIKPRKLDYPKNT
ncbi:predicted protein [Nematostella vectensis]|uniref:AIMP2 thioredoxin-like domain-containing protein n=1 Tax=Nematostella vectensis TaxID=45351 RepID=A7RUH6_NEMVE|nr:predicted protein [Nematostella vectensis]|eukprot:XP_001636916.1 predicted protein [Nematostella vectensis]